MRREQAVLRHGARLRCLAVGVETRRDRRPGFAGRLEGRCEWLGSFCVSGEGEDAEQALSRAFHRLEIELAEVLLARQRLLASADERDAA